jgi:hypothetical protein
MHRLTFTVLLFVAVGCCTAGRPTLAKPPQQKRSPTSAVQVDMRNVMYHITDQVAVHILQLQGLVLPTKRHGLPVFDDIQSFTLAIHYAEIAISTEALSHILNHDVFAAPDAPIKDITVTTAGDSIKVQGKLHAKGDLPFETEGTPTATPEGHMRIHTRKVTVAQVSVKGLMDLLGLQSAQLLNTDKVRGVRLEGNDLLLDPTLLLPPPHITGRVTEVRIAGEHIIQVFGTTPPASATPPHSGNYMAYRGGQLRVGKLTMADADVVLIDMDPQDPFDVSLAHYKEQLVAGYTQTTPDFGLRVFMRDFNKVQNSPPPQRSTLSRQPVAPPR